MTLVFQPVAWTVGPVEIVIVGLVGLLIFGKRIPDLAKSLGRSIVEFKKGLRETENEDPKALGNDQADILPPPEKRDNNTAH
ncbi:MAG: Sec-independent protein translocase subunit TatA/TatB [Phycisphaerae bacterium]